MRVGSIGNSRNTLDVRSSCFEGIILITKRLVHNLIFAPLFQIDAPAVAAISAVVFIARFAQILRQ